MRRRVDVCLAGDARFPGGVGSSIAEELLANVAMGYATGFFQCESSVIRDPQKPFNRRLQKIFLDDPQLYVPEFHECKALIFQHPTVVGTHARLPDIEAREIIVLVNHPMRDPAGKHDFNLVTIRNLLQKRYGRAPRFLAVGPTVRDSFDGEQVDLIDREEFWYNIFGPSPGALDASARRQRIEASGRIVIGRHSRDSREKWPEHASVLRAAYPEADDIEVRVMGGAATAKKVLGTIPKNWRVTPFGAMPATAFLDELDVFVYFHHSAWVEAFGRVIAEAMAAEVPTILSPNFRSLFGEAAICCEPSDVPHWLAQLRSDRDLYMQQVEKGRALVRDRFSWQAHKARMDQLLQPKPAPKAASDHLHASP